MHQLPSRQYRLRTLCPSVTRTCALQQSSHCRPTPPSHTAVPHRRPTPPSHTAALAVDAQAGGVPGKIKVFGLPLFDPFNFLAKSSADVRKTKRVSELKNGRLAMIGIMSVIANHYVPGSVPIFSAGLVSGNY